jgi:hypothetical protein
MSPLQTGINQDLENALSNQGTEFLKLSNKEVMDDLRECTGEHLKVKDLTMLLIINQWRRKERRLVRKASTQK